MIAARCGAHQAAKQVGDRRRDDHEVAGELRRERGAKRVTQIEHVSSAQRGEHRLRPLLVACAPRDRHRELVPRRTRLHAWRSASSFDVAGSIVVVETCQREIKQRVAAAESTASCPFAARLGLELIHGQWGGAVVNRAIRTVLVVDDDPLVGAAFQRGLKRRGITAVVGRTLAQGRALAHTHHPDACIVDFQLSGQKTGLQLVQDLRTQLRDSIIVLVSAYASMELGARAIRSGADHAIAKPVEIDEILRRLEGLECGGAAECCTATDEHVRWEHMQRVLMDCGDNRSETARRLGIDRTTLQRWLARPPLR